MSLRVWLPLTILLLAGAQAQASCRSEVGTRQANLYVKQCREVSPATHPPCNAQNSCALITGEIKRACALLGNDAPAYCGKYK